MRIQEEKLEEKLKKLEAEVVDIEDKKRATKEEFVEGFKVCNFSMMAI